MRAFLKDFAFLAGLASLSYLAGYVAYMHAKTLRDVSEESDRVAEPVASIVEDLSVMVTTGNYTQRNVALNILVERTLNSKESMDVLLEYIRSRKRRRRLAGLRSLSLLISRSVHNGSAISRAFRKSCTLNLFQSLVISLLFTLPGESREEDVEIRTETIFILNQYLHFHKAVAGPLAFEAGILQYIVEYIMATDKYGLTRLEVMSNMNEEQADEQVFTIMSRLYNIPEYNMVITETPDLEQAWSAISQLESTTSGITTQILNILSTSYDGDPLDSE
ncbi:hypothetical protein V1525DRAFT_398358 [Lipomyces kononenkoae]|uniref:Uncharacterized protein n=1 Tax=Lipomyces kononenkoae TaxID=34357 RepID=A0ACC3T6W0_LIPKO